MKKHLRLKLMAATLVALALPWTAPAQLINIDFIGSDMTGAAVLGSGGDTWNYFNTAASGTPAGGALVNSSNAATGASLSYFTPDLADGFNFSADGTANPAALFDGIAGGTNGGGGSGFAQITFNFTGLAPNTAYDIVAYGASQTGTDRGTHFFPTVGGAIAGSTTGASTTIAAGDGVSYATFQLTTDGSGDLTIHKNFNSATSAQGPVNGFQLQQVPEPSTFALAGFGLASLALRRRRRAS